MAYRTALDSRIDRLFHYQQFNPDYLENTIHRGTIRFARASEFNDPWDCKPSFFVPEDADELRALVDFMSRASERGTSNFDRAERSARADFYLQNPDALRKDLAAASAEMWAQMDRRYRMYCLSTKVNCPLMWSHYADHHRGVCLEFNVRTTDFCLATQIGYSADYPQFRLDDGGDLAPFYSKSLDWSYEDEYRLVAQEESEAFGLQTLITRGGFYQLSPGALMSIIIGSSATEAATEVITDMAQAAGLPIRKAVRVPNRYELTIVPPL